MSWIWLLACTPRSSDLGQDALHLIHALDAGLPLGEVLRECEAISDPESRGDCKAAAVIAHQGTELGDCEAIEVEDWRAECIFRLAERTRSSDLERAVEICNAGQFARECIGHLVRDEAKEHVQASMGQNEAHGAYLASLTHRGETLGLYWEEWAIARVRADLLVQREECGVLREPSACIEAQRRARRRLISELGPEHVCEAYLLGQPELVMSSGHAQLNTSVPSGEDLDTRCAEIQE